MDDLFFIFRITVITVIVVFLLGIKVGEKSLDERAMFLLQNTTLKSYVQKVADRSWEALQLVIGRTHDKVSHVVEDSDMIPGQRQGRFRVERAKQVLKQAEEKAVELAKKLPEKSTDSTEVSEPEVVADKTELIEAGPLQEDPDEFLQE